MLLVVGCVHFHFTSVSPSLVLSFRCGLRTRCRFETQEIRFESQSWFQTSQCSHLRLASHDTHIMVLIHFPILHTLVLSVYISLAAHHFNSIQTATYQDVMRICWRRNLDGVLKIDTRTFMWLETKTYSSPSPMTHGISGPLQTSVFDEWSCVKYPQSHRPVVCWEGSQEPKWWTTFQYTYCTFMREQDSSEGDE